MRTQEPTLRITRWLRAIELPGPGIPFEAECSACADAQFKIKHDKRSEGLVRHVPPGPPDHDRYRNALQRQFEEHLKLVHPDERVVRDRDERN